MIIKLEIIFRLFTTFIGFATYNYKGQTVVGIPIFRLSIIELLKKDLLFSSNNSKTIYTISLDNGSDLNSIFIDS
jgi:hypothetical protein